MPTPSALFTQTAKDAPRPPFCSLAEHDRPAVAAVVLMVFSLPSAVCLLVVLLSSHRAAVHNHAKW